MERFFFFILLPLNPHNSSIESDNKPTIFRYSGTVICATNNRIDLRFMIRKRSRRGHLADKANLDWAKSFSKGKWGKTGKYKTIKRKSFAQNSQAAAFDVSILITERKMFLMIAFPKYLLKHYGGSTKGW